MSNLISFFKKTKKSRESFQRKIFESLNIYYKYPGIYIKKGQLKESEYEKLRDKLIHELRYLQDPLTNEKVFPIVEKRESMYSGRYSKYAPDIVTLSENIYDVIFSYDSNVLFDNIKMHLRGKHFSDMYGIFLAYGGEIQSGTIKNVSILDIFPTVLHILDVPLSKDLDGQVLKDIFKKNSQLFIKRVNYSESGVNILQEKSDIRDILQDIEV